MKTQSTDESTPDNLPDYTLDSKPGAVCVSHSDIANLAYRLWEERGYPEGRADDDWREAEQRLIHERA